MRPGRRELHADVDALCERIDLTEPDVHAYVEEADRRRLLHVEADRLLAKWPDATSRPPLFGVALAVKDVMHVDGWVTRGGSRVEPAVFAGPEATMVSRLRAAGALVIGKSVTAEFASSAPGPTRNPLDLTRSPGGSSSGSAAAVSAGTATLATGTQTIGSVIRPAAFCGIVGLKPTHGRASVAGIIAHSPSFDTPGVLARDVATARAAAAVSWDEWTWPSSATANWGTARRRLVIPAGAYLRQAEQAALDHFAVACGQLDDDGWELVEADLLPDLEDVRAHNRVINRYELAGVHAPWFDAHRADYRSETAASIDEGRQITDAAYLHSRAHLGEFRAAIDARLVELEVPAVLAPAALGPAPVGIDTTGDPAMAMPWTYAGLPALALPAGRAPNGLPLGLQLVGRRGSDEGLVALAEVLPWGREG